jgi:ribonuclease HI
VPLTAKFPTTCGVCSAPIKPGDQIAKAGPRWAHLTCAGNEQPALPELASASGPAELAGTAGASGSAGRVGAAGSSGSAKRAATRGRTRPDPMPAAAGALEVWTDGACSGNPGPGGWAWATEDGRQASGGSPATTNQRMEVQAALEAIKALEGPLVVVSDSTYVVNCFRDAWWKGWLARGWVNSAKKPVANRDLWEPLITVFTERGDVSFRWVKGHSGDVMNDRVDRLAVEAGRAVAGSGARRADR